jgi:hypothetical protein
MFFWSIFVLFLRHQIDLENPVFGPKMRPVLHVRIKSIGIFCAKHANILKFHILIHVSASIKESTNYGSTRFIASELVINLVGCRMQKTFPIFHIFLLL